MTKTITKHGFPKRNISTMIQLLVWDSECSSTYSGHWTLGTVGGSNLWGGDTKCNADGKEITSLPATKKKITCTY